MDIADTHQLAVAAGRGELEPDILLGIDLALFRRIVDEIFGIILPLHQLVYALIGQLDYLVSSLGSLLAQFGIIFGHTFFNTGRERTGGIQVGTRLERKGSSPGHTSQIGVGSGDTLLGLVPIDGQTLGSLVQVADNAHERLLERQPRETHVVARFQKTVDIGKTTPEAGKFEMIPCPKEMELSLDEPDLLVRSTHQQVEVLEALIADADLLPSVPEAVVAAGRGFGDHVLPCIGPYPPVVSLRKGLRSDEIFRAVNVVAHIEARAVGLIDITHEFFPVEIVDESRKILVTAENLLFVQIRFLRPLQVILAGKKQRGGKQQ